MTTLFLSAVGGGFGGSLFGPVGRFVGSEVGTYFGSQIDNVMFGLGRTLFSSAQRLGDLNIQTATYGKVIPLVYGGIKISGNIIWSLPIKEVAETNNNLFAPVQSKISVSYSYYLTCAIAICAGVVNKLVNIYVNDKIIDRGAVKYRFYHGDEEQEADYLITEVEKQAPAYRGISYIVIEDFPLAEYNNRVPNFSFEVIGNVTSKVSDKITAVNITPGSGEFVYDTKVQSKSRGFYLGSNWVNSAKLTRINQNSAQNIADAVVALDDMQDTLQKLQWVSVVVNWFCSDLNILHCDVYPAVEYKEGGRSVPEDWQVAGITREKARKITQVAEQPLYGGTVSDNALLRYLRELKKRGYKVLIYPMLLVDVIGKPWRGEISGDVKDLAVFFSKYNKFILHYAKLTQGVVDGIVIGSELKGITQIVDNNTYPAVTMLSKLAHSVRGFIGGDAIITYAANWDEYHSHNQYYYMDELWSSPDINVVGIDAYFPLTDSPQKALGFSEEEIKKGWVSGEGYDYYYADYNKHKGKHNYTVGGARWAWKNIKKWWEEDHYNPGNSKTNWRAKMKKVWFLEYGFPSVDGATNQPNVFVDRSAGSSGFPFFSNGNIDFTAQATAIEATIDYWKDSEMVENMFLWSWDARPFPEFPSLTDVWSDSDSWEFSHQIQGKLVFPRLGDVVADILRKGGYADGSFDCAQLKQLCLGFVLNKKYDVRSAVSLLQQAYHFDVLEHRDTLLFKHTVSGEVLEISQGDLVPVNGNALVVDIAKDIPNKVEVIYLNKMNSYELSSVYAELQKEYTTTKTLFLPLVLHIHQAQSIAEKTLSCDLLSRTKYHFNIPLGIQKVSVSDIVKLNANGVEHLIKVSNVDCDGQLLYVSGVAYDPSNYGLGSDLYLRYKTLQHVSTGRTIFEILDLPMNTEGVSIVKNGEVLDWKGATLYICDDEGGDAQAIAGLYSDSICGVCSSLMPVGSSFVVDESSEVIVVLRGGQLESVRHEALLNSEENLALIGDEIVQFRDAQLLGENQYKLSGFLRGRYSTEHLVEKHRVGERFVLLNTLLASIPVSNNDIGQKKFYKAVSCGAVDGDSHAFTYQNNYLKPFSVVNVTAERRGDDNNIMINWVRRSRVDSDLRDYIDVPLMEEFERYQVDIYKGDNVIRTIDVKDATYVKYKHDDQMNDFQESPRMLKLAVFQMSAIVGRGVGEAISVTVH